MTTSLACINLKGGVGKTAISVNFAAYCGKKGLKTLLIDLDPQTNATFSCIDFDVWQKHAVENGTVANLLGARAHTNAEGDAKIAEEAIITDVFENVDLLPSHLDLFTVDLDLAQATAREARLRKSLKSVKDKYDLIVCDCPPNLTIPTQNALALCTHYAVPVSPDFLSAIGIGILLQRVKTFCDDMEKELDLAGIIISRVGRPAIFREQTVSSIRTTFKKNVLDSEIKERVAVSKSTEQRKPIFESSDINAIEEFTNVSEELLDKMGFK